MFPFVVLAESRALRTMGALQNDPCSMFFLPVITGGPPQYLPLSNDYRLVSVCGSGSLRCPPPLEGRARIGIRPALHPFPCAMCKGCVPRPIFHQERGLANLQSNAKTFKHLGHPIAHWCELEAGSTNSQAVSLPQCCRQRWYSV